MIPQLLISVDDIVEFFPLSLNLGATRSNPYIIRAREANLSSLLGPTLYYALVQAVIVAGDRFDKLFNGEDYFYESNQYRQRFPGIRQLLCAYAYSYIVDNNAVHVTRGGVNKKIGEQTENATDKTISLKSQEAYAEAIRLEGEFRKWIYQREGVYPEYRGGQPAKETSPSFWNASRRIRYPNEW